MKAQDLFDHIDLYRDTLRRRKWLIILSSVALGLIMTVVAFLAPVSYRVSTVFHPETLDGGSASGFQIPDPISLLIGSNDVGASGQQMVGILKSKRISEAMVADSIDWNNSRQLIADIVIAKTPVPLKSMIVNTVSQWIFSSDSLPSVESKVIKASKILTETHQIVITDEGFISFSLSFPDSYLVQVFAERYIDQLEAYYLVQKTDKAQRNVEFFSQRADSVRLELNKIAAARARQIDQDQYQIFARDMIKTAELEANLDMLKEMYIRLVTSREQFIAQLKRDTPVIQVLDPPKPPFGVEKSSPLKNFILSFIGLAIFLSIWFTRELIAEDLKSLIVRSLESEESAS